MKVFGKIGSAITLGLTLTSFLPLNLFAAEVELIKPNERVPLPHGYNIEEAASKQAAIHNLVDRKNELAQYGFTTKEKATGKEKEVKEALPGEIKEKGRKEEKDFGRFAAVVQKEARGLESEKPDFRKSEALVTAEPTPSNSKNSRNSRETQDNTPSKEYETFKTILTSGTEGTKIKSAAEAETRKAADLPEKAEKPAPMAGRPEAAVHLASPISAEKTEQEAVAEMTKERLREALQRTRQGDPRAVEEAIEAMQGAVITKGMIEEIKTFQAQQAPRQSAVSYPDRLVQIAAGNKRAIEEANLTDNIRKLIESATKAKVFFAKDKQKLAACCKEIQEALKDPSRKSTGSNAQLTKLYFEIEELMMTMPMTCHHDKECEPHPHPES
ncbi:MAG: hypothetical protein HY593_04530 [Candidatus Omnitrophica bacterium]|nr:hypothetical protein [Candidatus Omnitrophota bacterium]